MESVIQTQKLTKYYNRGKVVGVKDLNLSVGVGKVFGFIGPNGAGKSTTIRLLLDLIRPSSGSASVFGLDVNNSAVNVHQEIGYLPGEIFLPEGLTGQACINYYAGFKSKIDRQYIKKLCDRFDFDQRKKISQYSKGNKQKLAVILALMHKPKLLLLDEPTSGLDPLNQQQFYETIAETKEWGATVFFSTHILSEADRVCDDVGFIKEGKLMEVLHIDEWRTKNVRNIFIETEETIPHYILPKTVTKITKINNGYHLVTSGKIGLLLVSLAKYKIDDMRITEPSLEELFMHYYNKTP